MALRGFGIFAGLAPRQQAKAPREDAYGGEGSARFRGHPDVCVGIDAARAAREDAFGEGPARSRVRTSSCAETGMVGEARVDAFGDGRGAGLDHRARFGWDMAPGGSW